jgi:hypothetical protein
MANGPTAEPRRTQEEAMVHPMHAATVRRAMLAGRRRASLLKLGPRCTSMEVNGVLPLAALLLRRRGAMGEPASLLERCIG